MRSAPLGAFACAMASVGDREAGDRSNGAMARVGDREAGDRSDGAWEIRELDGVRDGENGGGFYGGIVCCALLPDTLTCVGEDGRASRGALLVTFARISETGIETLFRRWRLWVAGQELVEDRAEKCAKFENFCCPWQFCCVLNKIFKLLKMLHRQAHEVLSLGDVLNFERFDILDIPLSSRGAISLPMHTSRQDSYVPSKLVLS